MQASKSIIDEAIKDCCVIRIGGDGQIGIWRLVCEP